MTKARVPLWGTGAAKYVTIDTSATQGATLGVDLRWPNGTLVKPEDFQAPASGPADGHSVVLWELVQKIPAPVSGLAGATGEGVYRIGPDGEGFTDSTTSDLPEGTNLYFTDTRADARVGAGIAAHVADTDPHVQYAKESDLGSAAFNSTSDFATAAQGALADSALQPGDTLAAPAMTGLQDAADDAAAAAAGVAVGGVYRNGSALMIRVA